MPHVLARPSVACLTPAADLTCLLSDLSLVEALSDEEVVAVAFLASREFLHTFRTGDRARRDALVDVHVALAPRLPDGWCAPL